MKSLPLWIISALISAIVDVAEPRTQRRDVCPNPGQGPQNPWEIWSRAALGSMWRSEMRNDRIVELSADVGFHDALG